MLNIFFKTNLSADANNPNQTKLDWIKRYQFLIDDNAPSQVPWEKHGEGKKEKGKPQVTQRPRVHL